MILINDVKYSCLECIRGHRSSSCKHHTRPLLQVRSKGRPGCYANGNPNHRVAVFAQEILATPDDSSESSSPKSGSLSPATTGNSTTTSSGSTMASTANSEKLLPIIILKASSKQVIDLTSGQIVGPYDESQLKQYIAEKAPPQQPVINDDSFIVTTSGQLPKINKKNGGGGCACNKKKTVNKSKILESYIKKRLEKDQQQIKHETSCCSGKNRNVNGSRNENICSSSSNSGSNNSSSCCNNSSNSNSSNSNTIDTHNNSYINQFSSIKTGPPSLRPVDQLDSVPGILEPIFEMIPLRGCSVPGTCCCDSNCSCQGCVVHGNKKGISPVPAFDTISDLDVSQFNSNINDNDSENKNVVVDANYNGSGENLVFNIVPNMHTSVQLAPPKPMNSFVAPVLHLQPTQSINFAPSEESGAVFTALAQPQLGFHEGTQPSSFLSSSSSDSPGNCCTCPPNQCECLNCETHGILNGYKLDEYFLDPEKLMNALASDFYFDDLTQPFFVQQPHHQQQQQQLLPQQQLFRQISEHQHNSTTSSLYNGAENANYNPNVVDPLDRTSLTSQTNRSLYNDYNTNNDITVATTSVDAGNQLQNKACCSKKNFA